MKTKRSRWYIKKDTNNIPSLFHRDCSHWNKGDGQDGIAILAKKIPFALRTGACKHFPPRDMITQIKLLVDS